MKWSLKAVIMGTDWGGGQMRLDWYDWELRKGVAERGVGQCSWEFGYIQKAEKVSGYIEDNRSQVSH